MVFVGTPKRKLPGITSDANALERASTFKRYNEDIRRVPGGS